MAAVAPNVPASPSGNVNSNHIEREMNRHQRSLVDDCFEESQYEAAIAVLEQLRSPYHKPCPAHIRQLLYIALFPPPPLTGDKGKEFMNFEPGSPSKVARQQKYTTLPSPTATIAAQRLLSSFVSTNSPGALSQALPNCSTSGEANSTWSDDEDEDSFIAREALAIKRAKNCWTILKEGFIQRKKLTTVATPRGKGKKRKDTWEDDAGSNDCSLTPAVVSDVAWPVLEWLIRIFERDEISVQSSGLHRHSPLLLSQIPAPRGGVGLRWDVEAPLEIVFFCLHQTDERRKLMGARLMALLINLSSTIHLDRLMFTTAVFARLSTSPSEDFTTLLTLLPTLPAISRFKLALCQKFLIGSTTTDTSGPRPKPQARAQPRAIRAARRSELDETAVPPINAKPSSTSTTPISQASKYILPPSTEILRMVELNPTTATTAVASFFRIKFELVVLYGTLQSQASDPKDKDAEWAQILGDGRFKKAVEAGFRCDGDDMSRVYRESLEAIHQQW